MSTTEATGSYSASDLSYLEGLDAVRKRPGIFRSGVPLLAAVCKSGATLVASGGKALGPTLTRMKRSIKLVDPIVIT